MKSVKWQPRGEGVTIYLRRSGKRQFWVYRFRARDEAGRLVEVLRSSRSPDLQVAKDKALRCYRESAGLVAAPVAVAGRAVSCGDVLRAYGEKIYLVESIKEATVRQNCNAFAKFVRDAFGREPAKVALSELSAERVIGWRMGRYAEQGLVFGKPHDKRLNYSINSCFAKCQAVFSRSALQLYKREFGVKVLVDDFKSLKRLPEHDTRFVPIPEGVVAAMDAAHLELDAPELIVYELARVCGLTKAELLAARWSWIDGPADEPVLNILSNAVFETKLGKKDRRLGVSPELVARWRVLAPCADPEGFIVPRVNGDQLTRRVNAWLASYLPDRQKKLHELRKLAGSEVLMRNGSMSEAAHFLGDTVQTAERYYASWLGTVRALDVFDSGKPAAERRAGGGGI